MIDISPGTIALYTELACPWAHVAVHRLWRTREELDLSERIRFDHRPILLEVINRDSLPKRIIDAEVPLAFGLEPEAGWQTWMSPDWCYPVSRLLAAEAVQAAKEQGLAASEALDRALRQAFFGASACITLRHVVLEAAESCPEVDTDALTKALDDGRARRMLFDYVGHFTSGRVRVSPHLFVADGGDWENPGVSFRWEGQPGQGYPVLERDDPAVYREILTRAAGTLDTAFS